MGCNDRYGDLPVKTGALFRAHSWFPFFALGKEL
jgi:hypothetical protein